MIDLGIDNNNKINLALRNNEEFIAIAEIVYRGIKKRPTSCFYKRLFSQI